MTTTTSNTHEMRFAEVPQSMLIKMLTDTYADPLAAAIRETISNAIDACRRRGVSIADGLRVSFESNIYDIGGGRVTVSDTGDGMDVARLTDNFLTYAGSTKRSDTSAIGAFGLGAKAPLAYTEAMSVYTRAAGGDTLYAVARRTSDGGAEFTTPEVVDDPKRMIDGTGTIVSFDVRAGRDTRLATEIIRAVARSLASLEDGECINCFSGDLLELEQLRIPRYVTIGEYTVNGADDKPVTVRVYAHDHNCLTRVQEFLTCAAAGFPFEKCCEKISYHNISYKVGQWLYPATGTLWDYTFPELVVEVPGKSLRFTPSRDTLILDGGQSTTIADNVRRALIGEYGAGSDTERGSHLLSTIYSFATGVEFYRNAMMWVPQIMDVAYGSDHVTYTFTDKHDRYILTFKLDELLAWDGVTFAELANMGNCIAAVTSEKSGAIRGYVYTAYTFGSTANVPVVLQWFEGKNKRVVKSRVASNIIKHLTGIKDAVNGYHDGTGYESNGVVMPFAAKLLGTINVDPFVRVADSRRRHERLTSSLGGVKRLVTFNADTLTGQEVLQVMRYVGRSHAGRSIGIIAMLDGEDENAARLRESVAGKCEFDTYQHLSSAEVQRILASSKTSRSAAASNGADDASSSNTKKIEELGKILHKASVLKPTQSSFYRTAGVKGKQFSLYYRDFNSKIVRVETASKWIEKGSVSEKFIVVPNDNAAVEMLPLAQLITGYSDMNPIIILDPERATEARMDILSELGAEILYDCNAAATGRASGTWAALMSVSEDGNELHVNAAKPYEYSLSELVAMIDGQACREVNAALQQSQPTRWGGNWWGSSANDTYGFATTALNALSFGSADTSAYDEALDILEKESKSGDFARHYVKLVFAEQNVTEIAKFEERINRTTEQLAGLCTIYNRLLRRYGVQVRQNEGNFIRSFEAFDLLGGREFARAFIEDGISVDDLIPAPSA